MAKEPPQTVGDLRRKAIIMDAEIAEAVEAFLANPKAATFAFGSGHVLDVGQTVKEHPPAQAALSGKIVSDNFRRTIVRTAVILATPSAK